MRNEIRYKWIFITLAFLLAAMVVAVQVRLHMAAPQVALTSNNGSSTADSSIGMGVSGTISTRDGEVVFDGINTKYAPFYAVVGNAVGSNSATHLSNHTLAYQYRDMLSASKLTVLGGMHSFKGLSGSEMTTTLLPGSAHQTLYDAFGKYQGALLAYDYTTGEILALVSVPSGQSGSVEDGYLTNRILGTYTPGSTIKIITSICALSQNPKLQNFTYTCTGSHSLAGGSKITCDYVHNGPLSLKDAIGHSCNCFFAALIEQFDVDDTCDILEKLGFNTTSDKTKVGMVDELTYRKGFATFSSTKSFDEVWKLIGQGCVASPIDMVRIAGAVVNGGKSANPYIVQSIYNPNEEEFTYQAGDAQMKKLIDSDAADTLSAIWNDAVETYYYSKKTPLDKRITHAKTGTSEHTTSNGEEYNNRLLLGVMEQEHIAFILAVEHLPAGSTKIITIANTLAQVIDEANR